MRVVLVWLSKKHSLVLCHKHKKYAKNIDHERERERESDSTTLTWLTVYFNVGKLNMKEGGIEERIKLYRSEKLKEGMI